ncbi:MAG: D-alanyl-D-alanine carboxypeptidase, partial [Paracoccus sp. (in: a-proteobacteria)]
YYNLFSRRTADAGIAQVTATNRRFLDDYPGADGIKTGYTRAAGFNLTASAQRGNKRLIATVFGGTSTAQRNQVMAELLDASFPRIPDRVREVRPQRPRMLVQASTTRRAQVEPTPAATQPEPQRMVLAASPAPTVRPAAASSLVAAAPAAPVPDLTEALRQAGATAGAAAVPASTLALAASNRPRMRPGSAAIAEAVTEAVAEAVAEAPPAAASASLAAPVLAASARPRPSPRREGQASTAAVVAAAEPATEAAPQPEASAPPSGSLSLLSSPAPRPRSETVILAAMGEGDLGNPEQLEIVRRQADSGRSFGVSLGLFTSQAQAERELLSLALQDGSVLGSARRHVADTRRGFDAQFTNLNRAQAQLACERLQSRAKDCQVIGR